MALITLQSLVLRDADILRACVTGAMGNVDQAGENLRAAFLSLPRQTAPGVKDPENPDGMTGYPVAGAGRSPRSASARTPLARIASRTRHQRWSGLRASSAKRTGRFSVSR